LLDVTPLRLSQKTPLGVSLFTHASMLEEMRSGPFGSRHLIEGLLSELELRAKTVGRRSTPWLRWQIPHDLLDSAEIMELMYSIGKRFELGAHRANHYCVCFTPNELTGSRVALFKGLGFNTLELVYNPCNSSSGASLVSLSSAQSLQQQLVNARGIASDYQFSQLTIRLDHYPEGFTQALQQLVAENQPLPDVINTTSCEFQQQDNFGNLYQSLKYLGYRVLGNDCFVRPGSELAKAQASYHLKLTPHGYNCQNVADIVGLGPGNLSALNLLRYENSPSLTDYLSQPEGEIRATQQQQIRLKLVLDNLLCYHQLDLKYFRSRYELDLQPIIEQAWSAYKNGYLFVIRNHLVTLTPAGIRQLTPLCCALIQQFD
tara:strand:- start:270 stop:1391 length:1122 start_codon:yes stop_codon:yes gene_type:complete